jgi:hypothetical protein
MAPRLPATDFGATATAEDQHVSEHRSIDCVISAELAFALRPALEALGATLDFDQFRCIGCKEPVTPLKTSSGSIYLAHTVSNPMCSLTYVKPPD